MVKIIEYPATHGGAEIITELGKTTISFHTDGQHMFVFMSNSAVTRRFLRTALRRMEQEQNNKREQER